MLKQRCVKSDLQFLLNSASLGFEVKNKHIFCLLIEIN